MLVACAAFAGCSDDADGGASSDPLASRPSSSVATAGGETSPSPSLLSTATQPPTAMPRTAYPPLSGFGEVHDFGSVAAITDSAGGTVLTLDRLEYIHCTPRSGELEDCLDGYRIEPVEGGRRDYAVAPTVKVTLVVEPETYRTGDLADLREFVAGRPSNLMLLQLDPAGRVVAAGQPWVP